MDDEYGSASSLKVKWDIMHYRPTCQILFNRGGFDCAVQRVGITRFTRIDGSKVENFLTMIAMSIAAFDELNTCLGQGSSFVCAQNVHRTQIMDRRHLLYDDLPLS